MTVLCACVRAVWWGALGLRLWWWWWWWVTLLSGLVGWWRGFVALDP